MIFSAISRFSSATVGRFALVALFSAPLALGALSAHAAPEVGAPAPAFTATTITGDSISLDQFKGQTVVLEWSNHDCPFVVKHYGTGNMQNTQKMVVEHGGAWITIVSSAEGNQGYVSTAQAAEIMEQAGAHATAKILDPSGEIGHLYEAKTTPHMFVIDPEGTLVYAGAIDDNSSARPETVEGAKNYVVAALEDLKEGRPVAVPQTEPYGCSVKY